MATARHLAHEWDEAAELKSGDNYACRAPQHLAESGLPERSSERRAGRA